jgi:L-seryl-tRNA(Ser) seleniumtransferase
MGSTANPYRLLPSVEEVAGRPALAPLAERVGRELFVSFVKAHLAALRAEVAAGLAADALAERLAPDALEAALRARVAEESGRGVRPALNATGVVLHTGLGRAPIHPEAAEAMRCAAAGYCVLEVDRFSGERNRRDERLGELLCRLTGAEAAIAVNNNAAAVLLTLSTFAAGRETVVSRGELVEIGGSFRVPDVMTRAGTRLVEVGTTNRTRIADYRGALGTETGLLMKVHRSNFVQVGFTEEVEPAELAELGRDAGLPTTFDLGSGLFEAEGDLRLPVLAGETAVREAVASGVDVVTCSGDKLLGGPQGGLLLGRGEAIEALRKNALYRALRLDKVSLAGLEVTVGLLLAGRADELPVRRMLAATGEELARSAEALARAIADLEGFSAACEPGASQPGSGSAPGVELATTVVRVTHAGRSTESLASALRAGDPPVFGRIQEGALLLDPRTLLPGQADELVAALARLL